MADAPFGRYGSINEPRVPQVFRNKHSNREPMSVLSVIIARSPSHLVAANPGVERGNPGQLGLRKWASIRSVWAVCRPSGVASQERCKSSDVDSAHLRL